MSPPASIENIVLASDQPTRLFGWVFGHFDGFWRGGQLPRCPYWFSIWKPWKLLTLTSHGISSCHFWSLASYSQMRNEMFFWHADLHRLPEIHWSCRTCPQIFQDVQQRAAFEFNQMTGEKLQMSGDMKRFLGSLDNKCQWLDLYFKLSSLFL